MHATVLTPEQIGRVHQKALEILERVGVGVPHAEMLSRLHDAGARVDRAAQRVYLPAGLIQRAIDSAGKQFTLYGRDVSRTAAFGVGQRQFNSIAGEAHWVDDIGGPRRFATLADVATAARCADALGHITIPGAMSDPHEVPVAYRCVEVAATMLRQTTKPITFWYHDRASARFLNELMIALRGSASAAAAQPAWYPFLEPISPLRFPMNGIDLLYETARLNLPVPIGPMAQMGLSAPCTVAGTLAQEHAEILAGIVITQTVKPGMPVCYGGICHAFDMRTTQMIFGGPEQAIFGVAMTQMGKHLGLPVYINVGLTDSKRPDAQAGLEAGLTVMLGAAAGADIYGHMGICGVDQATSLDILVMQDEIISYVTSVMRDLDFSDEAFGIDVTAEVVQGGRFIDAEHTAERFRRELWFPQLLDRDYYEGWRAEGARSMEDRCRARREQILKQHRPEPMDPAVEQAIESIVAAARRELGAGAKREQPVGR
ncbi:MAG: trimethylamine methyltransferase family protein [Lentisphaerae bacterium]|nr:trimethylamine methyltransferase family protein [Lentisphaerota bacterium]